eukprot:6514080-Pyramimonas_sp.AAC.1
MIYNRTEFRDANVVLQIHRQMRARTKADGCEAPRLPASDWSVVRIYPRFPRPIGPSCEYTPASHV